MELNDVKKLFSENLNRYKPIPFWSWNDELDPKELCRQIDWMHKNEIGGFFMHARGGLKTEYLSEEWMKCIKACADRAKELDMGAWAYDENGWPSGFAGGKLLNDPENCDKYIIYAIGEFDPDATVSYLTAGEELVRVTDEKAEGECLNLYIHTSISTADILDEKVVDKFIDLTHEEYKAYIGDEFSAKIRGFFTDEPQYFRNRTPYTRVVEAYFKDKYGVDILDELGLLFVEKKGYRKFRYRYWSAMQELMLHAFAEKLYNWCLDNGVEFTGHYVEERSLGSQIMCCGGVMPFYEYMTMPGIDWLDGGAEEELAVRQIASVAAQTGKKQVLTESYGCCGWQITPRDVKRIADFQFLNGVNMLCHHLLPYAEYGQRKLDHPAHYSDVNPWVKDEFASFNLYFARLGKLLSESREKINVAMLHPIRSGYFDYKREMMTEPKYGGFNIEKLDKALKDDCRMLSASGVSYHFLDEVLLKRHGFVDGDKIGCGECAYEYLVLPHILTMDESTEKLVRSFVQNGGKILILGQKPEFLEAEPYSYDYLNSNCTLEQMIAAQPFKVAKRDDNLYYTYREFDGKAYMMIQNASETECATQSFDLGDGIKSFKKLDLITLEEKNIPLEISLERGEAILVFPDEANPQDSKPLTQYVLNLKDAEVEFEENALTVDYVRYSVDGVSFSKAYPYPALFDKLLNERYEGELYLKYEFEIRQLPKRIVLNAEDCKATLLTVNGKEFSFTGCSPVESHLLTADITELVKVGINDFTVRLNWFQSENVYYALFGENVTESLKNCLVYDTELDPIYLSGDFGVYTDGEFTPGTEPPYVCGNGFYIGETPKTVTEPVTDGFPFFAGKMKLTQKVNFENSNISLRLEGSWFVAEVEVNGKPAGKLIYERELDISEYAHSGENEIGIIFTIGNRNILGPHHYCGPNENTSISPWRFMLPGTWNDGVSPYFADRYSLIKLGVTEKM